jgi:replication factor C subunit 3/5
MSTFLPWVEKYRPSCIDDIISHAENITTIKKLLENNALPHLLFHGTPGTGKTSTIVALANKIYGDNVRFMIMKLDASDDRGINSVREDIKGFAEKSNMFYSGVKLIILDEADAMTFDAQFALRRIIEKYSQSIRFCLICNYENKIIPAIRSRCANFRFSSINKEHIINKLKMINSIEKLEYNDEILDVVSSLSKGDLRKAINLLQTLSMQSKTITKELCYYTAGIPTKQNINIMVSTLLDENIDFNKAYKIITDIIKNNAYSLFIILEEVILILLERNTMINLISKLADIENHLTYSTFEDIYISAFVSVFKMKKVI